MSHLISRRVSSQQERQSRGLLKEDIRASSKNAKKRLQIPLQSISERFHPRSQQIAESPVEQSQEVIVQGTELRTAG